MLKDIVQVQPLGGHRLLLRFEDGVSGEIDLSGSLSFTGVFAPLQDPERFAEVQLDPELGTIRWPNGADFDPDVLYARITGASLPE